MAGWGVRCRPGSQFWAHCRGNARPSPPSFATGRRRIKVTKTERGTNQLKLHRAMEVRGLPGGLAVHVGEVGLQRDPADRQRAGFGRRTALGRMDLVEKVAVPVEERAVNAGGAGDRGDADLGVSGGRR
jgi:hypothetical protein